MDFSLDNYRHKIYSYIFIVLILSTTLLGYYGSVDKVSVQWLYISLLLLITFVFFTYKSFNLFTAFLKLPQTIFILSILFLSTISFFFANNQVEVLIGITKWVVYFLLLYSFYLLFKKYPISFLDISLLISAILLLEISYSLSTLFDILNITNFDNQYSMLLKGVTGNKNITSAVFAIKLPFVFYLITHSSKLFLKIASFLIATLTLILIFFLNTRSVLLGIILSLSTLLFIVLISKFYFRSKISKIKPLLIGLPFILSLAFFNYTTNKTPLSINNYTDATSTNARLRYYSHAFDQMLEKPLTGIGLGNWKIASVFYDKENVVGYTVPFNVHNDLLEIGAELGILGFLSYLFFILYLLYKCFYLYFSNRIKSNQYLVLLISFLLFSIDLNINFPTYRPSVMIMFLLCVSLLSTLNTNENEKVSV